MLLQFSVKNFKTFKEKTSLNLVASNYDKDTREFDNVYNDLIYIVAYSKKMLYWLY